MISVRRLRHRVLLIALTKQHELVRRIRMTNPSSKRNFILQQGLREPSAPTCDLQFSVLLFQPRLVGLVTLVGVVFQSPAVFLALAAVLWWSALFPRWNPFDAFNNGTLGARPGEFSLSPAPAPRRFAQGMAGTLALGIAVSLVLGWKFPVLLLEALLVAAVAALVFGRFCLGSFVFHLIRGRVAFAKRTLPWVRGQNHSS